jgi:site-specific recombinase XerC
MTATARAVRLSSATHRSLVLYRHGREGAGDRPATVARRLSALSSFYGHALRAGEIRTNPLSGLSGPVVAPGSGRVLTGGEIAALECGAALHGGHGQNCLVALLLREGITLAVG